MPRLLLALAGIAAVAASAPPGPAAGEESEARLAIIVTRHGVRSPLTDANQTLGRFAAQPWPAWEVPPGYLTPHGKEQMRLMGAYYRAVYMRQGLLSGRAGEDAARVFLRADSDERTIETARDLAAGLIPGAKAEVHARPQGERDALFKPLRAGVGHPDRALAAAAVLGRIGNDPSALVTACAPAFDALDRVLVGGKRLPAGKTSVRGLPEKIAPDAAALTLAGFTGPLRVASRCIDTFILEYADGKPLSEVGWGRVDRGSLTELLRLHALYFELTQASFYPSQVQGSNLANHIGRTLEQAAAGRPVNGAIGPPGERVVILVGHDTNLANLAGLLGMSWWLDGTQSDPVLPGGALVFELRQSPGNGRYWVRAYYVCQTLDQMRSAEPLTPENPPETAPIFIPQCSRAVPGYDAPLEEFEAAIGRKIDPDFVLPGSS